MIGFLQGCLISKEKDVFLIDTGGVAYETFVGKKAFDHFKTGDQVSFFIHTSFKQDSLELFGFISSQEKKLFLTLLKVQGIGPKTAMIILNSCSLNQLLKMIREENIKALTALPKLGKKTAQQLVLSLKDDISDEKLIGSDNKKAEEEEEKLSRTLKNLGFQHPEIKEALSQVKLKKDFKKDLKNMLQFLKSN